MNDLSFLPIEDIVHRLKEEVDIVIGPNFYAYKWPNSIEIKQGRAGEQIIVERSFGQFSEADQTLWNEWDAEVRQYLETYTLANIEEAVRRGVSRVLELRSGGVKNYLDARMW